MKKNLNQPLSNQSDAMKDNEVYNKLDLKFVKAIDEVIARNKELGIKPSNDSAIARIIYPSNRGIISAVRSRSKHIPHLALINFGKKFEIDMNYFYKDTNNLHYEPNVIKNLVLSGNAMKSGDNSVNVHAGNRGSIKGINTTEAGSNNTFVGVVEVNPMINNFISKINDKHIDHFFRIIGQIQGEAKTTRTKFEKILENKNKECYNLVESIRNDLRETRIELSKTREKLEAAQVRENEILREYISKIK